MTAPEVNLSVKDIVLRDGAKPFSLRIVAGSITGLAGLEKGGQEEFIHVLCGLKKPAFGRIDGISEEVSARGLRGLHDAYKHGIAYLPRDRKTEGIMASMSVIDNFSISSLAGYSILGMINLRRLRKRYDQFAMEIGIVASSPYAPIRTLSGGNQQKVLLARVLAVHPRVLLLNDPSRGVDHYTKQSMYEIYRRFADAGMAVVLLSSEIEELVKVADRTVVFKDGSVEDVLPRDEMTRDRGLSAMFGVAHV